jgi:hypothetical protein
MRAVALSLLFPTSTPLVLGIVRAFLAAARDSEETGGALAR